MAAAPIAHTLRAVRAASAYAEVHQDDEHHNQHHLHHPRQHHHSGSSPRNSKKSNATSAPPSTSTHTPAKSSISHPKKHQQDTASIEYEAVTILKPKDDTGVEMKTITANSDHVKKPNNNNKTGKMSNSFSPLFHSPPNIDLTSREVLFAIAVFFFLSVSVGLIVVLVDDHMQQAKKEAAESEEARARKLLADMERRECFSKDCLVTSLRIVESANLSVDPCEDMWSFSCGGWLSSTIIPSHMNSWSVTRTMQMNVEQRLVDILEESDEFDDEDSAVVKTKHLFNSCMNVEDIERRGSTPFREVLAKMGGWAIAEDWNILEKSGLWGFQHVLGKLHFQLFARPFFDVFVGPDLSSLEFKQMLQLYQGRLTITNRSEYLTNGSSVSPVMEAYKEYLRTVATLYGATVNRTEDFVESVVMLESQLAQIQVVEDDINDMGVPVFPKYKLSQLQKLCPTIRWRPFFRQGYPLVTDKTEVIISNEEYFRNLSNILASSSERVLNYYLMWTAFTGMAVELLSEPFRHAREKFNAINEPEVKPKARRRYCMDITGEVLGKALGHMYINRHLPESTKREVETIAENIRTSFYNVVNGSSWLDAESRSNVLEKIENLVYTVGHLDWVANEELVDEHYRMLKIGSNESYFNAILQINKYEMIKLAFDLENNAAAEDWAWSSHDVGPRYMEWANKLVIPAGLLQPPIYTPNAPSYLNYASVGAIIGHEMTHPFDKGESFLGEEAFRTFNKRRQCYARHYTGISLPLPGTNETWYSEGNNTVEEDFADINGIDLAYQAFVSWEREQEHPETKLPGIDLNVNELFFLAYGQMWCSTRDEGLAEDILNEKYTKLHAAPELRVLGTLSQSAAFIDSFRCSQTSAMYPDDMCLSMWP